MTTGRRREWHCRPHSVAVVLACIALGGCASSSEPASDPTSPTKSGSATTTVEQHYYESALARFQEYERRLAPITQNPHVNDQVVRFLKHYVIEWGETADRIVDLQKNHITVAGYPDVLSSEAISASSTKVRFKQCVQTSSTRVKQNGEPTPAKFPGPQVVYVTMMVTDATGAWKLADLDDDPPSSRPCSG